MIFRRAVFLFVAFLLVRPAVAAPAADNTLHWLGLKQISADTNAAQFMKVWQLPQTTALVAQTLDKLSRWPGHGATNAASAAAPPAPRRPRLLRILPGNLFSNQFAIGLQLLPLRPWWPVRHCRTPHIASGRPSPRRPRRLLANQPLPPRPPRGPLAGTPHRIEISRAGDWTLVGVGLDKNIAQTDFAARLATAASRFSSSARPWLEADFNPSHLTPALSPRPTGGEGGDEAGSSLSAGGEGRGEVGIFSTFNHISLSVTCDASNLLTRATLDLAHPFTEPLPAWQIPTNLIHGPLTSFAAVRGIAAWLAASPAWQQLQLAPAPDQACWWSRDGIPFQTYLAAPLPGASNQLFQLAGRLVQNANPWLATNAEGSFSWNPTRCPASSGTRRKC